MSRYRKIQTRMWGDDRFRALSAPPPNGQTLWVYLLTGPHTTAIPGLFSVGEAALAEALGWPMKGFRGAMLEITGKDMAKVDWTARVVWIPRAVVHNPPESPNVIKAWRAALDDVPECALRREALLSLKAYAEGLGEGFRKAFLGAFAEALTIGLTEPSPPSFGESGAVAVTGAVTGTPPVVPLTGDTPAVPPPGFHRFWEKYPNRVGQDKALESWRKKKCEPIADEVVAGLERTMAHITREGGKYIPLPATWLNQGRWRDEPAKMNGHDRRRVNDAWEGRTVGEVTL